VNVESSWQRKPEKGERMYKNGDEAQERRGALHSREIPSLQARQRKVHGYGVDSNLFLEAGKFPL
jgi:hypothetical protein